MRVHEIASELGLSIKELLEKCRSLGIAAPDSGLASLTDEQAAAIRCALKGINGGQMQPPSSGRSPGTDDEAIDAISTESESRRRETSSACPHCGATLGKDRRCPKCDKLDGSSSNSHIGLYGITQSGKTVFLASLTQRVLTIRRHERAIELDGWRPDVPTDKVRTTTAKICQKVVQGELILATEKTVYDRFTFAFKRRLGFFGHESYVFQSHDVSGELLQAWVEGGTITTDDVAKFSVDATRSVGLVFLIDPTPELDTSNRLRGLQDALWRCLLDRLLAEQGGDSLGKPVVFAISKCDDPAVATMLKMPTVQERAEAERDPDKLASLLNQQNASARTFMHEHMPQIWAAIDPDDADARVPKSQVIAISSTGLNGEELRAAGKLRPWRIAEPVVWVLNQVRPWAHKHWHARFAIRSVLVLCIILWGVVEWKITQRLADAEVNARELLDSGHPEEAIRACEQASMPYSAIYWIRDKQRLDIIKNSASAQLEATARQREESRVGSILATSRDKVNLLKEMLSRNDVSAAKQLLSDVVTVLQPEMHSECKTLRGQAETFFREQGDARLAQSGQEADAVVALVKDGKAEEARARLRVLLDNLMPWADDPRAAALLAKLKKDGEVRAVVNHALMQSYLGRFGKAQDAMLRGSQDLGKRASDTLLAELRSQDFAEAIGLATQVSTWFEQFEKDRKAFTRITEGLRQADKILAIADQGCDAAAAVALRETIAASEKDVAHFQQSEPKLTLLAMLNEDKTKASAIIDRRQKYDHLCVQARDAASRGDLRSARDMYNTAMVLHKDKAVADEAASVSSRLSEYDECVQAAGAAAKDLREPDVACAKFEAALKVWPQGSEATTGAETLRTAATAKIVNVVTETDKSMCEHSFGSCYPRLAAAIALASQVKLPREADQLAQKRIAVLHAQIERSIDLSGGDDLKGAFSLATDARQQAALIGDAELVALADKAIMKLVPGGVLWKSIGAANLRTVSMDGKISESRITYFCNSLDMQFVLIKPPISADHRNGRTAAMPGGTPTKAFYICATEITQSQYATVLGKAAPPSTSSSLPMGGVSWIEAKAFCAALAAKDKVDCDLPSECEWEYACRAGSVTPFSWGDKADPEYANYSASRLRDTVAAGRFPANAWGLYDMHGNVWEWCRDTYVDPQRRTGPDQRVRRGGSYLSNESLMQCDFREHMGKNERRPDVGFRVVVEVGDKEDK